MKPTWKLNKFIQYSLLTVLISWTIQASAATSVTASLTSPVPKTYDGTTTATLNPSKYTLSGVTSGDDVYVTTTSGVYATQNVGNVINVTVVNLTLGGRDASNYTLSNGSTSADVGIITAAPLSAYLNDTVVGKTYDGTITATLNRFNYRLVNVVQGETVYVSTTMGNYAANNVGDNIDVTVNSLTLGGVNASNYFLSNTSVSDTVGVITRANLSILANNAAKIYGTIYTFSDTAFSTTGLASGDAIASVSLSSTGASSNAAVGIYSIIPSNAIPGPGTSLSNYVIAYLNGIFTVESPPPTPANVFFNIIETGIAAPAPIHVQLCLNGKGPLSCQRFIVHALSLNIRATNEHYYSIAGIKVLNSGYVLSGCVPYSNGYCLFSISNNVSANINLHPNSSQSAIDERVNDTFISEEATVSLENPTDIKEETANSNATEGEDVISINQIERVECMQSPFVEKICVAIGTTAEGMPYLFAGIHQTPDEFASIYTFSTLSCDHFKHDADGNPICNAIVKPYKNTDPSLVDSPYLAYLLSMLKTKHSDTSIDNMASMTIESALTLETAIEANPGFANYVLQSMNCHDHLCMMVGYYKDFNQIQHPLLAISRDDGETWSFPASITDPHVNPVFSGNGSLFAAHCHIATCIATGFYEDVSMIQHPFVTISLDEGDTWL